MWFPFYNFNASDDIIMAPEGFLNRKYVPILKTKDVCIIELRVLTDGIVFHTIRHHPQN